METVMSEQEVEFIRYREVIPTGLYYVGRCDEVGRPLEGSYDDTNGSGTIWSHPDLVDEPLILRDSSAGPEGDYEILPGSDGSPLLYQRGGPIISLPLEGLEFFIDEDMGHIEFDGLQHANIEGGLTVHRLLTGFAPVREDGTILHLPPYGSPTPVTALYDRYRQDGDYGAHGRFMENIAALD